MRLATRQFKPKLTIRVRIFDEGKQIFYGNETPMSSPKAANGVIRLGSKMKSGDYALRVIVTDASGPKPKLYSQWTGVHVR